MIKMVVTDLDGTLLNDEGNISQQNLKAIQELKDNHIKFIIATGRPEQLLKTIVKKLNYEEDLIMYNGSVIGHPFKDKRTFSKKIDKHTLIKIIEYGRMKNITMMIYTQHAIYSNPNDRVAYFEKLNTNLPENQKAIFKPILNDYQNLLDEEVNKVLFIEKNALIYQEISNHLSQWDDIDVVKSHNDFIDIVPKHSNKGEALKFLAHQYNIDLSEIMAIGDQENDISMLKISGTSLCVSNANDSVKSMSTPLEQSNNEDAVAWAIKKYINQHQ